MDDDQVNTMVATDRIGLALGHQSEWELREVNSYMGDIPGIAEDRHPLRPQAIAQALIEGVNAVTDDPDTRQVLTDELTRALALEMRACYADIAGLFRSRGLRPQDLRVRATAGTSRGQSLHGGTTSGVPLHDSRYATLPGALHPPSTAAARAVCTAWPVDSTAAATKATQRPAAVLPVAAWADGRSIRN